jgi:O-antigen/teichoic acid export membrane protein
MAEEFQALPPSTAKDASLTQGLARNTIFNLLGWVWPIGLAIVSVPYILRKLGTDAYGVFSIVSIVAGYLGLLNAPVAMGNVRFMAETYANKKWSDLRNAALVGLMINGMLSFLGALIMFLAANVLARKVFAIPPVLVSTAVIAFRLAAFSFFLNGLVGALQSVPIAMRRYDIRNQVGLVVGTLNTVAIVLALWLGWGLLGAVMAQVLSSALGLAFFSIVAWRLLRAFRGSGNKSLVSAAFVRRLVSFSSLLFAGQVTSSIGLQIDRTLVGILLGTSAMAYYTVPTKITERIPGMMYVFTTALYPLSSEAVATNKLEELHQLYHEMIRILFWLSAFIAIPLVVLSKEILTLWVGPEFMAKSWLVFALLAAGVVWRSSGSVAYQVCNGMGRADINLIAAIGTAVSMTVPVLLLAPHWGAPGVAFGVFIGLFISNLAYDLFAQIKLLGGKSWRGRLTPYIRIILAEAGTIVSAHFLPGRVSGWFSLVIRVGLISFIFIALSLAVGALRTRDLKFVKAKVLSIVKRASSPILSGIGK